MPCCAVLYRRPRPPPNRLSTSLHDVEILVKVDGPATAERRAATWQVPSLAPGDTAAHSLPLQVLRWAGTRARTARPQHGDVGLPHGQCRPLSG